MANVNFHFQSIWIEEMGGSCIHPHLHLQGATGASIRLHFLGASLVSRVEFQPSSPNLSEEAHPLSIWKQMKREKQKPKKTEMASAGVAKPFNAMVGSFSSVRV